MNIAALVDSSLTQAVGWALIHSIWQGVLVALALWSVLLVSRSPALRYVAGLAAMVMMLAAFGATLAMYVPATMEGSPGSLANANAWVFAGGLSQTPLVAPPTLINLVAPYLSVFWAAGVCACHLWQIAGLFWVRRLKQRGVWPAVELWQGEVGRLAQMVGVTTAVRLFESLMVNTPIVVGYFRPLILVPAGLLSRLPLAHVEAILLHELAHIRRWDYFVNLLQRWVEGVFFYHPAMWWISHVVRSEREACCDEMAAAACGDRHTYASALAALEESRFALQGSPALAATGGSLRARIERILRANPPSGARGIVSCITIVVTAAALAFAGWDRNSEKLPIPSPLSVKEVPAPPPPGSEAPKKTLLAQARPTPQEQNVEDLGHYQKWLNEDVVYLISDVERTAFERLKTDEERQMFIQQFWQRREALRQSTDRRSAKEEHYRRIMYANERFPAAIPGWMTDRGRIYIVWGPPAEIEAHPSGHAGQPPFEIWRYRAVPGGSPAQFLTFVDLNNTGEYRLQTTGSTQPTTGIRILRWSVVDPLNRFVTGLTQDAFELRENGVSKPITYFEGPDSPTAVAVVSDSDLPGFGPGAVIQTRTLNEAVLRLRKSPAIRKAIIIVRGAAGTGSGAIPGGIYGVVADASEAVRWFIEITNQYVVGYRSDSSAEPEVIIKPVPNLPSLRIGGIVP